MANLTENPVWETGIYQFEKTDYIEGGVDGNDNLPTRQLANRTLFLKNELASKSNDLRNSIVATDNKLNGLNSNLTNRLNSLTLNDLAGANQAIANKLDITSFNSKIDELSNLIKNFENRLDTLVPIGMIIPMSGWKDTRFNNWHLCDGSDYSKEEYPELFSVLGEEKLPKITDKQRFIRSCDSSGQGVNTTQEQNVGAHTHPYTDYYYNTGSGGPRWVATSINTYGWTRTGNISSTRTTYVNSIDNDNRPYAYIAAFYIRMK